MIGNGESSAGGTAGRQAGSEIARDGGWGGPESCTKEYSDFKTGRRRQIIRSICPRQSRSAA